MEQRKQKGTSSSLTSELFGSKEPHPSSSSGIFGSIFSPPSPKVLGRESLRSEVRGKTANETWSSKIGTQDYISKGNDGVGQNTEHKDMSSIYQDQRVQPCHPQFINLLWWPGHIFFSSKYPECRIKLYGRNMQMIMTMLDDVVNFIPHKNNEEEDDPGIASRGNWWQGSLYY
ncbi:hypothetical protein SESBI_21264 [Sesbania bispinosa]|nr:hypothetical protein SESBI_21264 [Sesbania bispinosa]